MKIAYGVHGYGRGHAARALAVLPELAARHEVLVLAGGDAYAALCGRYNVVRLPVLRYALGRGGRRSVRRTLLRALPAAGDLSLRGPALQMVRDTLREFGPDVVVSDSEAWTHRAARRLGIPRISFDHFGVLVYCQWPMSLRQRILCGMEGRIYSWLMGAPSERIVIASFYSPPPRRSGVLVVGPVLREAICRAVPSRGQHLLVYFSNGRHHFSGRVEEALAALDCPVVVYGVGERARQGNLEFRPPSNERFVEDLAGCRAVFATAGNQLISEALHLRKPLLLLPEDSLEQHLNAAAIERMNVGMATRRRKVRPELLHEFLGREEEFAAGMPPLAADAGGSAAKAIEACAAELCR